MEQEIIHSRNTMKFELLFQLIFSYYCVHTFTVGGFEFEDNKAMTHVTEENGIAFVDFLVLLKDLVDKHFS